MPENKEKSNQVDIRTCTIAGIIYVRLDDIINWLDESRINTTDPLRKDCFTDAMSSLMKMKNEPNP